MTPLDLERSFLQYKQHIKLKYLRLNFFNKLSIAIIFFILLPTVILNIFFPKKRTKGIISVLHISDAEPYHSIYTSLSKNKLFYFVKKSKWQYPIVPIVLIKDIGYLIKKQPLMILNNLVFFGALTWKVSQYYGLVKKHDIKNLLVFQEYSFYSSYLTYVLENEEKNLYNVMHGVPNDFCCYFRFSKCFVWGEQYKKEYLLNNSEPTQFVISGSIFHDFIAKRKPSKENIDILYVVQGYVGEKTDTIDITDLLTKLSLKYKVRILQHPRNKISIPDTLEEYHGNIIDAMYASKIVLSRYSTALLDGTYIGKHAIAYIGNDSDLKRFVSYLPPENIIEQKGELELLITRLLNTSCSIQLSNTYIDNSRNPLDVIASEIMKLNKAV